MTVGTGPLKRLKGLPVVHRHNSPLLTLVPPIRVIYYIFRSFKIVYAGNLHIIISQVPEVPEPSFVSGGSMASEPLRSIPVYIVY